MRIERLTVTDFRRYRDLEVDLAPGLTIVRGPNEAGKSTIQRAIELALTRRVTSGAGDLDALVPWDAESDARSTVALTFTWEDDDGVTQPGSLEKAFRGTRGTVRLELGGEVITDPAEADERTAELCGIPTEAFYRSTASIRHHDLAGLQRDESALRDRLQASISGADRGTSRAKKTLERALFGLNTKGAKNPGRLKTAEEAVADTQARLLAGEQGLERLERDREAMVIARDRRSEVETGLAERRSLLEKARQAERLTTEREVARERYERYRQAVDVNAEIERLEAAHPSPNPLAVLRQSVARLRVLDGRIRELRAMLEGEIVVDFHLDAPPETRSYSGWGMAIAVVGLLIAAVTFGLDLAGFGLGTAPMLLGAAVAGAGVVIALVAIFLKRADQRSVAARQLRDDEITRRLRGRSEMEQELREAEADSVQQLEGLGLDDLATAEDLFAREEAHVAAIDQGRARLDGLVGKDPPSTLADQRDSAALEIEQKTSAIEAIGPIAKEPRARERLEGEVAEQERALERARDEEADARARVEQNPVDAEEVASLAELLVTWQEQLAAEQRRDRVFRATLDAIEHAEQATMQKATRYLERHMGPAVERITDGRYRRVRVDDTDFGIDVFAPEKRDWVSVTELSQGTLDSIYLAARIGLVRLVTGDRRPPLILDDPFVTLDDRRATRALELLRDLATDFQVIYLTTSERYDDLADTVVPLPGPTVADDVTAEAAGEPAHA